VLGEGLALLDEVNLISESVHFELVFLLSAMEGAGVDGANEGVAIAEGFSV
jgi:hypothetical protein